MDTWRSLILRLEPPSMVAARGRDSPARRTRDPHRRLAPATRSRLASEQYHCEIETWSSISSSISRPQNFSHPLELLALRAVFVLVLVPLGFLFKLEVPPKLKSLPWRTPRAPTTRSAKLKPATISGWSRGSTGIGSKVRPHFGRFAIVRWALGSVLVLGRFAISAPFLHILFRPSLCPPISFGAKVRMTTRSGIFIEILVFFDKIFDGGKPIPQRVRTCSSKFIIS